MKLDFIIISLGLLLSPARAEPLARSRYLMGTVCEITAASPPPGAIDAAFAEIARIERLLSTFIEESEVSALNRDSGRWIAVSPDTWSVFLASRRLARETGGAFDPTYASAPEAGGMEKIGFDDDARKIRLPRGARVDFGGIGKGYALDAAAAVLKASGVGRAMLNFGGQVLVFTPPREGEPWPVRIAAPETTRSPARTLYIREGSVSTSGAYEKPGHIVRPGGGKAPLQGSVSVIAPDATSADAWSTALFAAGSVSVPPELCAVSLTPSGRSYRETTQGDCARFMTPPGGRT